MRCNPSLSFLQKKKKIKVFHRSQESYQIQNIIDICSLFSDVHLHQISFSSGNVNFITQTLCYFHDLSLRPTAEPLEANEE